MQITTNAIVIRQRSIDEGDRLLTLLTDNHGVINAYAGGAKNYKSKLASSTEFLCYSRFILFKNKERYIVDGADADNIFFKLRQDMSKLSLAAYFSELMTELVPEHDPARDYLRLMLNSLHMLESDKREATFIKPVFELRALAMSGYMPNLIGCVECGSFENGTMYFLPQSGSIICGSCIDGHDEDAKELAFGSLSAMRHIIYSRMERIYGFKISPETQRCLGSVTQEYLLRQTRGSFKTLEFYNAMLIQRG